MLVTTVKRLLAAAIITAVVAPSPSWADDEVPAGSGTLRVSNAAGQDVSFDALLPDAPIILHLWATWCMPCRVELPALDRFSATLDEAGAKDRLIVVSVDAPPYDKVAMFLDDVGVERLTSWQVTAGNPGSTFRIFGYPTTILLGPDRSIEERWAGPVDWDAPSVRQHLLRKLAPTARQEQSAGRSVE
ncbi:TlpA family protein disulfide reductase [Consotaella aegiceratis]|uniref:TlpA family protein disulfide reductase n=1 Tax=Consotaella aegiceratis TaxID=3097961 RepID=UPI002F40310E